MLGAAQDLHGTISVLKAYQAQRIAAEFSELRLGAGSQCGDSFTLVPSAGDVPGVANGGSEVRVCSVSVFVSTSVLVSVTD